MPARGTGPPPRAIGRPCRKCGGDLWRLRSRDKKYRCVLCDRSGAKRRAATRRENDPIGEMCRSAKARALRSGVPFTIGPDDVRAVWPADNCCPVLGIEFAAGEGNPVDASPTLDRLNNSWGYEPGNIAVISFRANRSKGNMRASELESIVRWMRAKGLE